jgi:acetylornithine deacetylase/succinyl-diaminopimelate desuccinylase-like protein
MNSQALEFARANRERYLAELKAWLAIPSVSALSQHQADIQRAAEWIARELANLGLHNVAIFPTAETIE